MAKPYWKIRWAVRLQHLLTTARIAPSGERLVALPVAKRLAIAPAPFMLGDVPEVPWRDEQVTTRDGESIRVRVYEPAGATVPLLYAHGGGFVVGGIDSCDHICRQIAHDAGVVVVSVEYRLSPEHAFPGPLNDCDDVLAWLRSQDWDSDRLLVGGDSAGGNLAAALAMVCREAAIPLRGQLLLYPALDMTVEGEGVLSYRGIGLTRRELQICARNHLGGADPCEPLASPLHAPDLTGLAPAYVLTAEHDALRWEGREYARRLRAAGVDVQEMDVPGFIHGALSAPALHQQWSIDEVYAALVEFIASRAEVTSAPPQEI